MNTKPSTLYPNPQSTPRYRTYKIQATWHHARMQIESVHPLYVSSIRRVSEFPTNCRCVHVSQPPDLGWRLRHGCVILHMSSLLQGFRISYTLYAYRIVTASRPLTTIMMTNLSMMIMIVNIIHDIICIMKIIRNIQNNERVIHNTLVMITMINMMICIVIIMHNIICMLWYYWEF